jgi:hypothetical protein
MRNRHVTSIVTAGLLLAGLAALSGQTPAHKSVRHLVYEFGYNTKVASSGNGTGTTTIDILGPAKDGGVMISGTDSWWNTARPRATNTCELYSDGRVSCSERPYALSPIQLTLFPLLAHGYFSGLSASGTSSWKRSYPVLAAILPGASGLASSPYTWNCTFSLQGKGPIANADGLVLVLATGKLVQQGGRYLSANSKQRIVYDPVAKVPAIVRDERTHLPQRSVYNVDVVEVKLIKDSQAKQ